MCFGIAEGEGSVFRAPDQLLYDHTQALIRERPGEALDVIGPADEFVEGNMELGTPVKTRGYPDSEVFVGLGMGEEGEAHSRGGAGLTPIADAGQFGPEGERRGGVGGSGREGETGQRAFGDAQGHSCPLTPCMQFVNLLLEVVWCIRKEINIVCEGRVGEVRGWDSGARRVGDLFGALEGVAPVALLKPAEEGLHGYEEEEGGHRVPLDRAAFDMDVIGEARSRLDLHGLALIDGANEDDGVRREAQHRHCFEETVMRDRGKAVFEVDKEHIDIGASDVCVFQCSQDGMDLVQGGHLCAETPLLRGDDVVSRRKVREKGSGTRRKEFVKGISQGNGAVIGGMEGVAAFGEEDIAAAFEDGRHVLEAEESPEELVKVSF